jgi:ferredoxin--NADP+ reductase
MTSGICKFHLGFMLNATLVNRIEVTPELVRIFVRPDVPFSSFLSGQYVALGLPGDAPRLPEFPPEEIPQKGDKLIKRAYSIGSSPAEPEVLEFYVALLPQGALTARLANLKVGDRLFCATKITGHFTLEGVPENANLVLVSTGTGLAPFMSMMRTPSTWKAQGETSGRSITVLHGVRYPQDLAYREEIEAFAQKYGKVRYLPMVSRGGSAWKGASGHVQSFFKDGTVKLDPSRDHVFLCGNPAMIDEMELLLTGSVSEGGHANPSSGGLELSEGLGFTVHSKKNPGNLHLERYW